MARNTNKGTTPGGMGYTDSDRIEKVLLEISRTVTEFDLDFKKSKGSPVPSAAQGPYRNIQNALNRLNYVSTAKPARGTGKKTGTTSVIKSIGDTFKKAISEILNSFKQDHKTAIGNAQIKLQSALANAARAPVDLKKAEENLGKQEKALKKAKRSGKGIEEAQSNVQEARLKALKARQFAQAAPEQVDAAKKALKDSTGLPGQIGSAKKTIEQLGQKTGFGKEAGKVGEGLELVETGARAAAGDPIAIAQLAKKAIDEVKRRGQELGKAGQSFGQAVQSEKTGDIAGHGFEGIEHVGNAMSMGPGSPGWAIEIVGKFGKQLSESLEKLRTWNDRLHESNMQFAEFSGAMTGVQANQEARDIMLSQERGNRRANSAEYLAAGRHNLNQTLSRGEDVWARAKNLGAGFVSNLVATAFDKFGGTAIVSAAEAAVEWLEKQMGGTSASEHEAQMAEALRGAELDAQIRMINRPNRFR